MLSRTGVVDYGMGNLHSVCKALEKAGAEVVLCSQPKEISRFDRLVVPGVGAFGDAAANLKKWGLFDSVKDFIRSGNPYLGICLGMQMLVEESLEKGIHTGFGFIPGTVRKFPDGLKVPQIGWNQIRVKKTESRLFNDIPDLSYFYLVHSYYVDTSEEISVLATADYGIEYACALEKDNVFGVQFHPEKSQKWGLKVLENFVKL